MSRLLFRNRIEIRYENSRDLLVNLKRAIRQSRPHVQ